MDTGQLKQGLMDAGRMLYQMGMVPATSGNFSARVDADSIAITVSGCHKGYLREQDIMLIDNTGHSLDGKKPSAETLLHTQLYQFYKDAGAVLHPHNLNAVLVSRQRQNFITLRNYELLKAFSGIKTHATSITIPIFENDQDMISLSQKVADYLKENDNTYAYIIAGHGMYTWGKTINDAMRHIEALDYLFACELRLTGVH